jgi:hypothetical protein
MFIVGTVALVLLLLYVGAAAAWATQLSESHSGRVLTTVEPGDILRLTDSYNLSNPGPFAVTGVTVEVFLDHPNGSFWFGSRTPVQTIDGGGHSVLRVEFSFPLGDPEVDHDLLVNDSTLPYQAWVNGTYAGFVAVSVGDSSQYSWGAPFEGLNASLGSPTVQTNGSVSAPLELRFNNHSPIDLVGTLSVVVRNAEGASCGGSTFPVSAASHDAFDAHETFYLPTGCSPSGASYGASWTGSGLSASLPLGDGP